MRWITALFDRFRTKSALEEPSGQLLSDLEARIDIVFKNPSLLVKALKHRSYVYARQESGIESNERLEFLGDAVLDLLVAEYLFGNFSDKREGSHANEILWSLVVRCCLKAIQIGLGRFILLSTEERGAGGDKQPSILCDAFEALLGALYLDGGIEGCRRFVKTHVR